MKLAPSGSRYRENKSGSRMKSCGTPRKGRGGGKIININSNDSIRDLNHCEVEPVILFQYENDNLMVYGVKSSC